MSAFNFLYLLTIPDHSTQFSNTVLSLKLDEEPKAAVPPASVLESASVKRKI